MNQKESLEINEKLYDTYCGILFHSPAMQEGPELTVTYDFDCPQFSLLREKYALQKIAGQGSDFQRALRVNRYLHPHLRHASDYDNHVECNSLALMEYCLNKKDVGINCLNKAKILQECCLALGIYARRVGLYPYSPYDMDNHVATEIYDRRLKKWILLDPTTGGYFSDEAQPLSCPEIRSKLAHRQTISVVLPRQSKKDIAALSLRNIAYNVYYAKNFCFLSVDLYSGFGEKSGAAFIVPQGFSVKNQFMQNFAYKLQKAKQEEMEPSLISLLEKQCDGIKDFSPTVGNVSLWNQPF